MHVEDEDPGTGTAPVVMTIGAVSRSIGVPAPTIRSWEWRYQLPTGHQRQGGQRRYTPDDVASLTRMRDEIAAGRSAAAAAALVVAAAAAPPRHVLEQLLRAAHDLQTESIVEALQRSCEMHGLTTTIEEVALPALREIGRRWAAGTSDVAHEHLLTNAIQHWIAGRGQADSPRRSGAVVLACGPEDQHTLALEAFTALLVHEGFDCRYLGAQTPVSSLVLAARDAAARVVVVVSHLDRHHASAASALRAVAALPVALCYAGSAFADPHRRHGLPGTYLGQSLSGAVQVVTDALADRSTAPAPATDH